MPVTVGVNNLSVVHKASNGISTIFPDVCKTPSPVGPVPIPYPNIAMSKDAADTAKTVKADGNPIMLQTSKYSMSTGDEAGSAQGVVSNKIKGSANPQMWSMDVKADGKNVFRQLDIMLQNGNSMPVNTPPGTNLQPPVIALAQDQDPEELKVKEVKWSETKLKCGDPVKIQTKTENYDDGMLILHIMHMSGDKKAFELTKGTVSGNSVKIDWLTKNGPWKKKPTKLKIKAHGIAGAVESSNELEIEKPAEKSETVNVTNNTAKAIVGIKVPFTRFAIGLPIGTLYGNPYGYDISLKQGIFQIKCKVQLIPKQHVKTGKKFRRNKKLWKKEIETIWARKWKEHRSKCKRKNKCNCPGGCCLFPIRVKCSFVSSGGHVRVNLNAGPASYPDRWWNAGNWYEKLSGQEGNGAVVHAHEFGHNIGLWDEYPGGATMAAFYDVAGSIMQSGKKVMKQHWDTHPTQGKSIHKWFSDAVDEDYKLIEM